MVSDTTFYIKTKSGIEVTIPINNKVTILTGDSATGKTKMCKLLSNILTDKAEVAEKTVDLDTIIVCLNEKEFINAISANPKGKIIFADRFDRVKGENIFDYIDESSNLYVLCAHCDIPQCGYSLESLLGLKHDGKRYIAEKLFESQSDFMNDKSILI